MSKQQQQKEREGILNTDGGGGGMVCSMCTGGGRVYSFAINVNQPAYKDKPKRNRTTLKSNPTNITTLRTYQQHSQRTPKPHTYTHPPTPPHQIFVIM